MDEDFSLDELTLAFSWHMVNQILGSDGIVAPAEAKFLSRTFPKSLFTHSGFVSAKGEFTQRWYDALGEALLRLPELPIPQRSAIVATFFQAAVADDDFQWGEAEVIRRAARLLGLGDDAYADLVEALVTHEVEIETTEG